MLNKQDQDSSVTLSVWVLTSSQYWEVVKPQDTYFPLGHLADYPLAAGKFPFLIR